MKTKAFLTLCAVLIMCGCAGKPHVPPTEGIGMSKRAVLISCGPPPEHVNRDLSNNKWVYYENKLKRKYICFDENEKAISCGL